MNVLICCGGTLSRSGVGKHSARRKLLRMCKCNLPLRTETIGQRMARMFKQHGLKDVTMAYTNDKPTVDGVSFRKVEYRYGLLSTVYQCRDLIGNTLIALGDIVFSEQALTEILAQEFNEILYVANYMVLLKPGGSKLLRSYFQEHKEEFTAKKTPHYFINLFFRTTRPHYFEGHVKFFIGTHFIGDIDGVARWEKFRRFVDAYLNKGKEPKWINGWQKRAKDGYGEPNFKLEPIKMWWEQQNED